MCKNDERLVFRHAASQDSRGTCIMGLLISHHDQLAMGELVERPVLRVHVVDAVTGDYLRRPGMAPDCFPTPEQQQAMLNQPGHDTMTTVYDDNLEAFTAVLSYVPAIQTQASAPLVLSSAGSWALVDMPFCARCRNNHAPRPPRCRGNLYGRKSSTSTTCTRTRSSTHRLALCCSSRYCSTQAM